MKQDKKKYLLKVKYKLVEFQNDKKVRFQFPVKKKFYIESTESEIQEKIASLEETLSASTQRLGFRALLSNFYKSLKTYGKNCHQTYLNVLRY